MWHRSLLSLRRLSSTALAVCAVMTTSCVLDPVNRGFLGNTNETFRLNGMALAGSALIVVEARNQQTDDWEEIARTTSQPSPIVTEDTFPGTNTPDLFFYSVNNVAIASSDDPQSNCRWHPSCQIQPGDVSAELRVRQIVGDQSRELFVGEAGSQECHVDRLREGDDFYTSGYECGYDTTILHLRVIT